MITNTVENNATGDSARRRGSKGCGRLGWQLSLMMVISLAAVLPVEATTVIGEWVPMFKGVDHSVSTNLPVGSSFRHRMVIHPRRVDLTDTGVRLSTTTHIAH